MSATFKFMWGMTYTRDGVTDAHGSLTDPVKEVTIPGDYTHAKTLKLPKATSLPVVTPVMLWDYTQQQQFEALVFVLRGGAGYVELAWLVDKPVSASDLRPQSEVSPFTTTHRRVNCVDVTCDAPFVLNTDLARVHATLATATGLDGNGYPSIMTDASTVEGRVARVWAGNYATDADVYCDVFVLN